jgi:hypothetical protein
MSVPGENQWPSTGSFAWPLTLRYPVESLLELLASGMTIEEIIEDHPDLERDDLLAALEFGALVSAQRQVPLGAA